MLAKIKESPFVLSPFETTIPYDDTDCDGYCLMDDIEAELNLGDYSDQSPEHEESRVKDGNNEKEQ